jgi:ferrochelatase
MSPPETKSPPAGGKVGVLLLNLGGPWTLDDIKPFLRNLFNDRDIIPLPGGPALQGFWARFISTVRTPKVRTKYAEIGGGSPLLMWTRQQAQGLVGLLNGASEDHGAEQIHPATDQKMQDPRMQDPHFAGVPQGDGRFVAALGMRYSPPTAAEALEHLKGQGCRRVVVLPLYPQECVATTGSSFKDLERAVELHGHAFEMSTVRSFHTHPLYLQAMAERIREGLKLFRDGEPVVLFSAHGVPIRIVETGDPYVRHVRETVDGLLGRLGDDIGEYRLAYQSRTGPVRWTEPGTEEVLEELGRTGKHRVLVVPISFVSDHIETLHEVDIEFREVAVKAGIEHYHRAPSLNDSPVFLQALRDIVLDALSDSGEVADLEASPDAAGASAKGG